MSYRSVKRVLGETRLELKCLVLFAICLLTLIGGSFWWYGGRSEAMVFERTRNACRQLVQSILLQKHCKWIVERKLLEDRKAAGDVQPTIDESTDIYLQNIEYFG